jgi:hypothetical protein
MKHNDALTPIERAVRLFVYEHFLATGAAPDGAAISQRLAIPGEVVSAALRRLAELHALVLAPSTTNIWMAHPFSAVPTAYRVATADRAYWANCAWDALGIMSLAGDGECGASCPDCGDALTMGVRDGRLHAQGVVHYAVPARRFWENIAYT